MRAYWTLFIRNLKKGNLPLGRAIISDIMLWVALVLLVGGGVYLFMVQIPEKQGQTIVLRFKDANEVIKGSSVHMMGVEIGYVSKIKIQKDFVDVTVQAYPDALPIPSGSTFTILFTGLGGSKSIEIELPEGQRVANAAPAKTTYWVEEPIRFQQTLEANINVTRALQGGAENIADFFGKKKPVEELQFNIRQVHQWTEDYIGLSARLPEQVRQARQEMHRSAVEGEQNLHMFQDQVDHALQVTDPKKIRPTLAAGLNNIEQFKMFLAQSAHVTLKHQLIPYNRTNAQLNQVLRSFPLHTLGARTEKMLITWEQQQTEFFAQVNQLDCWLQQHPISPALQKARQAIQAFNQTILGWNAALTKRQRQKGLTPVSPKNP